MMKISFVCFLVCSIINVESSKCGCRTLSTCYIDMLNDLHDENEAYCIEDAAIGSSSLTVYLKAINKYCSEIVSVSVSELLTNRSKHLYQVDISDKEPAVDANGTQSKPTIIIDAGQDAGLETVRFALFLIEQLVACEENRDMVRKVKWIVMPSTNPDGLEYARYNHKSWRKNLRLSEDSLSFGVDLTRNFDTHWASCLENQIGFSPTYPGPEANSENETVFIKTVLNNNLNNAKIYVSLRRDGNHIAYPYAYSNIVPKNSALLCRVAAEVAAKVNLRSNSVNQFTNTSIYDANGKAYCGHSVDFAFDLGIYLSFEMGVFLEAGNDIVAKFQAMPRGYEASLRRGYFSGIRELYNVLTNGKKYGVQ